MHADLDARRSRVAASWIVALVVTAIAGTAHVLAGGTVPHPTALVAGALVSGFLSMAALAGVRGGDLSRRRLALVVVIDQAAQHLALSLLGPAGGAALADHGDAAADHATHAALGAPPASIAVSGIPFDAAAPALMGAHHALAAVAAFALLRRGAAAIAAALRSLGVAIARLTEPVSAETVRPVALALLTALGMQPSPAAAFVLGGSGRRGPPRFALAR